MNQREDEREINIPDLFWSVCLKWRVILVWAIIFALVAGGIGYYSSIKKADAEALEKKLDKDDKMNIDTYLGYSSLYKTQKRYNRLSPLMQLDPSDFYANALTFYVDNHYVVEYPVISESDNIDALVQSYRNSLRTEEFADGIVSAMSLQKDAKPYCMELVDLDNRYGGLGVYSDSGCVITLTVYGKNAEACAELADLVKENFEAQKAALTEQFGEHDITLIYDITKNVSDVNLSYYQKTNLDYLNQYNNELKNAEKTLSDIALDYVDVVKEVDEDEEQEGASPINIKLIVIGFIIGAFLVLFIEAIAYILNKKLRYEDDFESIFGIKLLGAIVGENTGKKRLFGFIDRWMIKKRHANIHKFEAGEAEDMIGSNIKLLAKNAETDSVYVTGATIADIPEDLLDTLVKRLGKEGITLTVGKSIIYNADALEAAAAAGNVVLIDKAGVVTYNEVYSMLDTCDTLKINVLGGVVVA